MKSSTNLCKFALRRSTSPVFDWKYFFTETNVFLPSQSLKLVSAVHECLQQFPFCFICFYFQTFLCFLQTSLKEKEDKNKKVLIQAREKLQQLTGVLRELLLTVVF